MRRHLVLAKKENKSENRNESAEDKYLSNSEANKSQNINNTDKIFVDHLDIGKWKQTIGLTSEIIFNLFKI